MNRFLILLLLSSLFLNSTTLTGQSTPKLVTTVEGIKEYELDNGLRVLLIPDGSQSNITVNIVYKVGSRHEGYGETGMAHLIEHMLFKQCEKFTDIKKAIADKGAFANGTTWYDRTNYYEILSASDENLRWAIDMESDRMVTSKILPEELKKEFSVVRNEFEIGENYPTGVLNERVLSTMYLWHNYGKSTIGSKEDIERVKAETLKTFYKKYYQPDNAVLIIAGKFDEKKALDYTQQYFGPIPKPTRVLQTPYTVEPAQDGQREVTLRRVGDIQYLALGYHTPALASADYVANDALVSILTNDPSGILYKKLVETKLATKEGGYTQTLHDPGFTYYYVEVPKDKSLDSAKNVLLNAADGIVTMKITEEDLTRAKNTSRKSFEDLVSKTENLAISLTEFIGAGDWRLLYLSRDRMEKLSIDDVQAAARRYYKTSNRTLGMFIPDPTQDRTMVDETPDIAKLLTGYTGNEVAAQKADFENSIPNIKKTTEYGKLPNGAKYALLEKPTKGDKINGVITLHMGDEKSLTNKTIYSTLLADMLKAGTTTRSRKQIADELDRIKTDISFGSYSGGQLSINVNTDKQNLAAALALLDDLLHHPKFDANEFDKVKLDMKTNLEASMSDPASQAFTQLSKLSTSYPKGHPLYSSDFAERLDDLSKVKLEDIKKFYTDFYGANNSVSAFVGELDKKQTLEFLRNSFGKWNSKLPYKEVEVKYFDIAGKTERLATPDKTTAVLAGTINVNLSQKNPDYPAMYMANELLGGGAFLSSRIPQRLREQEGMSYGAGSYMNSSYKYNATNWGLYAYFNPLYANRLDSALHEEVDKARSGGFTKDELTKSVSSWLEGNRTSLGMNNYVAGLLSDYLDDDRKLEDFADFETKIKALDTEKVNAALRKYFDPAKLILISAGDFKKKAF